MSKQIRQVIAFVDWQSQILTSGAVRISNPAKRAQKTVDSTVQCVASALRELDSSCHFVVKQRLYHGWHQGITPTENRRAIEGLNADADFKLQRIGDVTFSLPLEFGDRLLSASPHRLRKRNPQIHLPDTYRTYPDSEPREKMVDTALAADLLSHARSDPTEWRVVLAEDDDIVPPLFVAEHWSKEKGGRTVLLRKRPYQNHHIDLTGLLMRC